MNAALLSDSELREKLLERSIDVGIIDDSTRPRYQKRLQKLLDLQPAGPAVNRSPAARRSTPTAAAATRRKSVRTPQQQQQQRKSPGRQQVASFSSDEADLSQPEDRPPSSKARTTPSRSSVGRRTTGAVAATPPPTQQQQSSSSRSSAGRRASAGRTRRSAAMNTSASLLLQQSADDEAPGVGDKEEEDGHDDDDDEEEEEQQRKQRPAAATRRRRTQQQQQQQQQRQPAGVIDRLQVSDADESPPRRQQQQQQLASNGGRHRQQQQQQQQQQRQQLLAVVANGGGQQKQRETTPASSSASASASESSSTPRVSLSAMVPNLMLAAALLLSLSIAGLYAWQQNRQSAARQLRHFEELMCPGGELSSGDDCRRHLQTWVKLARPLYDLLAAQRGDYECGVARAGDWKMSRRLATSALADAVSGLRVDEAAVSGVVRLSLMAPQLGILALRRDGAAAKDAGECEFLAAADGRRSLRCRASQLSASLLGSALRLATTCLYALLAALVLLAAGAALRRLWLRRRRQLAAVADAAEQVLVCLAECPDQDGMPVADVEAELERSGQLEAVTWRQVRQHVVTKESRVVTDEVLGLGEVWRLKAGVAESVCQQLRGAAGWQGSVLPESSLPTPPAHPPTQCLKIRGMWSPDNGQCDRERIVAELHRRVAAENFLHVDLLGRSGEGFVYALCKSRRLAGEAWAAIHANYFDGHLVTVKYMTLEKYCHRFPEKQKEFMAALAQQQQQQQQKRRPVDAE